MAGFDVQGARAAGHSDASIVDFLKKDGSSAFDFDGAMKAGYTPSEILNEVTGVGKEPGVLAPLQHGAANLVSGVGSSLRNLGATNVGPALERAGENIAPKNYDDAYSQLVNPKKGEGRVQHLPRAAAEGAPGFATDLLVGGGAGAAAGVLGGPLAPVTVPAGVMLGTGASYFMRNFGPNADARARNRTGDPAAEANTSDKMIAAGGTTGEAALASLGGARLLNVGGKALGAGPIRTVGAQGVGDAAKRMTGTGIVEAHVGAGQGALSQATRTAGTDVPVDANEIAAGGAMSGALGTGFAARRGARDAVAAVKFRDHGGDLSDATNKVANRIQEKAGDDLGNTKHDFRVVDEVGRDIRAEINRASNEPAMKVAFRDNPDAANALDAARSAKVPVSDADIDVLNRALNGMPEGNSFIDLVKQSVALDRLKNAGDFAAGNFKGGSGAKLEKSLRLLQNPVGAATGLLAGHAAMSLPMTLPAVAAVGGGYLGARAVDSALGLRSPTKSFVRKFADASGVKREAAATADATDGPFNPRSNITIDEGMARVAQRLESGKRKSLIDESAPLLRKLAGGERDAARAESAKRKTYIAEALPALRKLSANEGPNAPTALPGNFAATLGSGDGVLPNPLAKPPPSTEVPPEFIRKTAALVKGISNVKKMKDEAAATAYREQGAAQADAIGATSPLLGEVGGLNAVDNPAMGKRASALVSAANAVKKLTAEPEADKPTKPSAKQAREDAVEAQPRGAGKASAAKQRAADEPKPSAAEAHVEEAPYSPTLKHTKVNAADLDVARKAADQFRQSGVPEFVVKRYHDSTANRQARIRDRLQEMSGDDAFPSDNVALGEALAKMSVLRRRSAVADFVSDLASEHPEAAAPLMKWLGPKWTAAVWNKK